MISAESIEIVHRTDGDQRGPDNKETGVQCGRRSSDEKSNETSCGCVETVSLEDLME